MQFMSGRKTFIDEGKKESIESMSRVLVYIVVYYIHNTLSATVHVAQLAERQKAWSCIFFQLHGQLGCVFWTFLYEIPLQQRIYIVFS